MAVAFSRESRLRQAMRLEGLDRPVGFAASCSSQLRAHLYLPGRRQPGE